MGGGGTTAPSGAGDSPDQDQTQEQALTYTQQRWTDLKNAFTVYHQAVWQALLFYANESWIQWDDSRKIWTPDEAEDEWTPRPRINRFSPTVDAVASNFARVPDVDCMPTPDDDPVALMVSTVSGKVVEWVFRDQGLLSNRKSQHDKSGLAAQLFVLGGGFITEVEAIPGPAQSQPSMAPAPMHQVSCPTCDKVTEIPGNMPPPTSCPMCTSPVQTQPVTRMQPQMGPDGQPQATQSAPMTIKVCVHPTLNAFPRAGAKSMDDTPFYLDAERMTLDAIYERWQFDATADNVYPDGYSVTYEQALNFWYTGYASSTLATKDSAMVLRMFVPPGKVKDFPDGFTLVMINETCVAYDKWDLPEHPMSLVGYLTLPTIFFPRSVSFDMCYLQQELNAYEAIIKLHGMTTAADPWVVEANSLVSEITGRGDKLIKWRANGPNTIPPKREGPGHLDDGIYKQRDSLHAEFQNISMAVNAFRGQQEGAVTAGTAINQLRGQAELMFGKPTMNWNTGWSETARKVAKFAQKYWSIQQFITACGPNMEMEIRAFQQADLDSTVDFLSSEHGMPRTRDEKRQEFEMLWDKGALDLTNPDVKQKVYELFGETGMMKEFNMDATRARLENTAIKQGKRVMPMPDIEDLQVHLYIHKNQVKSLDFDKWPPPAKKEMFAHIQATQMYLTQQMQAQLAAQIAAEAQEVDATGAQVQIKDTGKSAASMVPGGGKPTGSVQAPGGPKPDSQQAKTPNGPGGKPGGKPGQK